MVVACGFLLLCGGLFYVLSHYRTPQLAKAICQPSDLSQQHHYDKRPEPTFLHLGETVVESYTVSLADRQLSYTVLDCSIVRYADETAAHHAFERLCADGNYNLNVGQEACTFAAASPTNLTFRRSQFLVIMNGDIGEPSVFPTAAVDARLQMKEPDGVGWCSFRNDFFCNIWQKAQNLW